MRLINTTTYELKECFNPDPYAILSHTWRGDECTYAKFVTMTYQEKKGYEKLDYLCSQALRDGYNYAWIDTVCIDKSSSAELSEAINSMFMWYQEAQVCYVYLDDVDKVDDIPHSRWISRGWTLQELIAPRFVRFYGHNWALLGTKSSLMKRLVNWTNIDQLVLEEPDIIRFTSAATRMSWAARRNCTRIEDTAYSLLGIFGVNMPLLYGERDKAFSRLQVEILTQHGDLSILLFSRSFKDGLLASSPKSFQHRDKIINTETSNCELTPMGLRAQLKVIGGNFGKLEKASKTPIENIDGCWIVLPCRYEFDRRLVCIRAWILSIGHTIKLHVTGLQTQRVHTSTLVEAPLKEVLLTTNNKRMFGESLLELQRAHRYMCNVNVHTLLEHGFEIIYAGLDTEPFRLCEGGLISEATTAKSGTLIEKFGFVHRKHQEAFIITVARLTNATLLGIHVKPNRISCQTWLKEEGMDRHVVQDPSFYLSVLEGRGRLRRPLTDFANLQSIHWQTLPSNSAKQDTFSPYHFKLTSQSCFSSMIMNVETENWDEMYCSCLCYKFSIEPSQRGDHHSEMLTALDQ